MGVQFGGEKAWLTRSAGDLGIAYHWVNGEPSMVLFPRSRRIGAGAYVIPIDSAHRYVHSDGHPDISYMVAAARTAARVMGYSSNDAFIARQIVDAIADGIPDLIDMPPEPQDQIVERAIRDVAGELTIKVDGETIKEETVTMPTVEEIAGVTH